VTAVGGEIRALWLEVKLYERWNQYNNQEYKQTPDNTYSINVVAIAYRLINIRKPRNSVIVATIEICGKRNQWKILE
jgi:hypothetical protein